MTCTTSSPPRRRRRRLLYGAAALCLLGFLALCRFLDGYGQVERAQPAPAIVVLGSTLIGPGQSDDSLRARVRHAAALYARGLAPCIICTGGVGKYPPAESVVETALARQAGVPAAALLREEHSTSTWENARFAADICRAHGWTRVILVSDPYHLWRGRFCFARHGITAYPSPARDCRRNRLPYLRAAWTARDALLAIREVVWHGWRD